MSAALEIGIYVMSMALAFVAYIFSVNHQAFGLAPQNPQQATMASFFAGFLVFLIGDRIAAYVRERALKTWTAKSFAEALRGVPEIGTIVEFSSSDEAMTYVTERIPNAKTIYNTKVSLAGVQPRNDVGPRFQKAVGEGLKHGLSVKDIVSPQFTTEAEALQRQADR